MDSANACRCHKRLEPNRLHARLRPYLECVSESSVPQAPLEMYDEFHREANALERLALIYRRTPPYRAPERVLKRLRAAFTAPPDGARAN